MAEPLHEDLRVRREAIQALGLIGGPKATGLLVRSLAIAETRKGETGTFAQAVITVGGESVTVGPLLVDGPKILAYLESATAMRGILR